MILDSHAHIGVAPSLGWFDTPEKLIQRMDQAGVAMAAVSGYLNAPGPDPDSLKEIAAAVEKYPDRLIGYARLDPWFEDECIRTFEDAVAHLGMRGLKLHPAHYTLYPFGPPTVKLVRRAGELGLPVLIHCGDEMMCLPYQMDRLAAQCPDTRIILAHMGGFFSGEAILDVVGRRKNTWVDTSEIPFPGMVRKCVDVLGADKVLFGTDAPCCDYHLEILKIKLAGLTPEQERLVMYENYARLMDIPLKEAV